MRLLAARFLVSQERADACSGHGRACGAATGSTPFCTPCSSLTRGRGDELPSGAQLFFAVCFDWHLAGKYVSPFKVEQLMFLKSNQGCLPEVQKYNAAIAVQQERRSQYVQDVQSAQEAAAGETGDCRNMEELVRSGECMSNAEGMGDDAVWKKYVVECKPDRNRPADLTWNRKPDRNQTSDLTRNRKPDRSKPSFSGTVHFQPR